LGEHASDRVAGRFVAETSSSGYRLGFIDAVWRPDARACREASGACWGFIAEKHRFILFGTYPFEEHWRPAAQRFC
jgi:general L-amino acid transport system permease protein